MLVHLKTNRIFSLSPTGARFWELLSDGKSRTEIEAALLREYEVTPEAVSAEIDSLVRRWKPSSSCKGTDAPWSPTRSSGRDPSSVDAERLPRSGHISAVLDEIEKGR